tara:strand:- start:32 stop:820 length:789 start_codon:yes stop_codon:yes gene_type:complete
MLNSFFNNKNVVFVGPSPHLIGKKLGKFIDSFDTVVRVNELGVISEMEEDYGSRTDVAFLTLTNESLERYIKMKEEIDTSTLKLIIHPRDEYNLNPFKPVSRSKNISNYFKQLNLDTDFHHIRTPTFKERCMVFGCFPSTGSLAILEVLNYEFNKLYICGFSFYTTKYRYSPKGMEYYRIPKQNQHKHNLRKSGHDTRTEIKVLKSLIKEKGNVSGDNFFKRIVLDKSYIYYETRRLIIYKINFDYIKNVLRKTINRFKIFL